MADDEKSSKHLKTVWKCVKIGLAALLTILILAVLFLLYVFLFKVPDQSVEEHIYPPHGSLVQKRMEEFRWPDDGTTEWEFRIADGHGKVLFFTRIRTNRVTLPYTLLEPGTYYSWELFRIDEDGDADIDPVIDNRFRTARNATMATFWRPLHVFPDRVTIRPVEMIFGITVEISHQGPFSIMLPNELVFPDGEKAYESSGTVLLHLRWDFAHAAGRPEQWGKIVIRAGGAPKAIPVVPVMEQGCAFVREANLGFDPYTDTPSFANFSRSLFSRLTEGTCVGIVLVVKLFFERVAFGPGSGPRADRLSSIKLVEAMLTNRRLVVTSTADFRDLSDKRSDLIMDLMSELHYENLNPTNVTETIKAVLFENWAERTEQALWNLLAEGRLALVAGFRLRRKVLKTWKNLASFAVLDSGHSILAFRGWEFENASVFAVYDPNFEYAENYPRRTVLVFRKDSRPVYYVGGVPEQSLVRFLPVKTNRLFTALGVTVHGAKEKAREAGRAFSDLFKAVADK